MDKQQHSAAVNDMTAAIALIPDSASLFYQRAMAHYAMRDNELALQVWFRAFRVFLRHRLGHT
jgi:hypothetical protein